RTRCPDSVNSRNSSHALYAAIPPATPRITAGAPATGELPLDGVGDQGAGGGLAHGDGQRRFLAGGPHPRPDMRQQALTELAVVGVDLAGPLGREDHQRVLGRTLLEQLIDRRVGDALRIGDGHGGTLSVRARQQVSNRAILATPRWPAR